MYGVHLNHHHLQSTEVQVSMHSPKRCRRSLVTRNLHKAARGVTSIAITIESNIERLGSTLLRCHQMFHNLVACVLPPSSKYCLHIRVDGWSDFGHIREIA
jgi:hypothetical protein